MNKKVFLIFLSVLIFSCQSDDNTIIQEVTADSLVGSWVLTNYYSDAFRDIEQTGRIEQIVPAETDYEIEFTQDPNKILLTGLLRYAVEEYEIVDGEKVITSETAHFMESAKNEGYHVTDWRIENKILITEDPTGDGGDPFISKSDIELTATTLKLTLDSAQFNPTNSGDIILEYQRK